MFVPTDHCERREAIQHLLRSADCFAGSRRSSMFASTSRRLPLKAIATLKLALLGAVAIGLSASQALADSAKIAVAANFTEPVKEIAAAFKAKTGHELVLSFGASGQFFTQITQDAPFEVFLSADSARPKKLADEGFGVKGTVFTYAVGKLVLWSKSPGVVKGEETLKQASIAKVSICNPAAAPYGAAAVQTMQSLKLYDDLKPKLVEGANITQAYQFVQTGNAEIGFVALSQVISDKDGSRWMVPQDLYKPITQDAVLLKKGENSAAAKAFLDFLKGPEASAIIEKFGYEVPKPKAS
jgi:molybdate transport system substrate-binding protein